MWLELALNVDTLQENCEKKKVISTTDCVCVLSKHSTAVKERAQPRATAAPVTSSHQMMGAVSGLSVWC